MRCFRRFNIVNVVTFCAWGITHGIPWRHCKCRNESEATGQGVTAAFDIGFSTSILSGLSTASGTLREALAGEAHLDLCCLKLRPVRNWYGWFVFLWQIKQVKRFLPIAVTFILTEAFWDQNTCIQTHMCHFRFENNLSSSYLVLTIVCRTVSSWSRYCTADTDKNASEYQRDTTRQCSEEIGQVEGLAALHPGNLLLWRGSLQFLTKVQEYSKYVQTATDWNTLGLSIA